LAQFATDLVSQVAQRTDDASESPPFVFSCQLQHELLDFLASRPRRHTSTVAGTIELRGDQPSMPSQDRLRPNDLGHFRQSFSPQTFTDLGQGPPLRIAQEQPAFDLVSRDPVFGDEILVSEEEFLIDRTGDVAQQFLPMHG
jgi:hypothetical protein